METTASFIEGMRNRARLLSSAELARHYSVSKDNQHKCRECFCCICGDVLEERKGESINEVISALE